MNDRRSDRVGCPTVLASEAISTRVKRSAWACGPPGARSGVLGRSPNGDALSRSRRSLDRHVAASVRDASVSVSLTRFLLVSDQPEAASAPTQLSRAASWARSAHGSRRRAQHACKRVARVEPKRRPASTRNPRSVAKQARTRMCAPEHNDVRATRPARSACRLANINVCYAKRRAGAACAAHRVLVRSLRTRRDSPAVCITPHYVERQHRAAVWARGASAAMDGRNTQSGSRCCRCCSPIRSR